MPQAVEEQQSDASFGIEDLEKQPEHTESTADASGPLEKVVNGSQKSEGSKVGFSSVEVHSHRLTLGDNPGVSSGIPLTLGWEVEDSEHYDLDDYEKDRAQTLSRITRNSREAIAEKHHSRDSIVRVEREVTAIKHSRIDNETDSTLRGRRRRSSAAPKKKGANPFSWFRR